MTMQHKPEQYEGSHEDVKQLHSMGYAQELARRMSGFSNFAISFSIICILAGGITSFQAGFSGAGGASIGRGWGWATAWFNLLGLIFVVSSVDVGVWYLFVNMVGTNYLGMNAAVVIPDSTKTFGEQFASGAYWVQAIAIIV